MGHADPPSLEVQIREPRKADFPATQAAGREKRDEQTRDRALPPGHGFRGTTDRVELVRGQRLDRRVRRGRDAEPPHPTHVRNDGIAVHIEEHLEDGDVLPLRLRLHRCVVPRVPRPPIDDEGRDVRLGKPVRARRRDESFATQRPQIPRHYAEISSPLPKRALAEIGDVRVQEYFGRL